MMNESWYLGTQYMIPDTGMTHFEHTALMSDTQSHL